MFPAISHIDEVLPFIAYKPEIVRIPGPRLDDPVLPVPRPHHVRQSAPSAETSKSSQGMTPGVPVLSYVLPMWWEDVQAAVWGEDFESLGEEFRALDEHRQLQVLYINDHPVH